MSRYLFCCFLLYCGFARSQPPDVRNLRPEKLACTPVKDQYLSATCWSFSSVSLLESELLRKGKGVTDLSEMFIARYSMLRKIRRHLALKGGNYFTPGGQFHDAAWVIRNYGMVPEEAYSGKGRKETHHDHGEMDTILHQVVRYCLANGITALDQRQQAVVDSILDHYYGRVPDQFDYKGRRYTPLSFRDEYLGLNMEDYLEITSYTHHPFFTKFVLEDKYNWTGDAYWNLPLADFMAITDSALSKGYSVGWDGDAGDPDFHFQEGYASLREPPGANRQAERQRAFDSQTTLLDHMMHVVGIAKNNGHTWYYVKNSWGDQSNPVGGYLYMRDDYFSMRTVAIIVNREAIPQSIRTKMGMGKQ